MNKGALSTHLTPAVHVDDPKPRLHLGFYV